MSSTNTNPNSSLINNQNPNPNPNPNPSSSQSRSSSSSSAQPTTSACAACKYQRRRCTPDCTLAPYFRADHQRQFLNAHRLFGVSNILKIIKGLDQRSRDEAMKSIIFESNARAADPIGGCYGIICELERQLHNYAAELTIVNSHLEMVRAQADNAAAVSLVHNAQHDPNLILNQVEETNDNVYETNFVNLAQHQQMQQQQQQQQHYNYFYFDGAGVDGNENENVNQNVMNDFNINVNQNDNSSVLEMEMLSLHQKGEEEDVKPLVDMFEVRQPFDIVGGDEEAVSKETDTGMPAFHCSTSTPELRNETNNIEHVQEHDLKSAASLFTLTNCNTL